MKNIIQWHEAFRWFLVFALTGYTLWAWNAEAGEGTVQQPPVAGDFGNLRSLLEARGWRVERAADGSTLLFPLRSTPQAAEAGDGAVQQPPMTGDFNNLRKLLEARGWRIERTPDGSTLLIPSGETPPAQEPEPASITLTVSSEEMQPLSRILEAYKWNLIQESSNAIHLQAPAHPHTSSTTTKGDCAEEQQESLFTAGVKLPVNTNEEAWQISSNWLWASGYTELGVGDIRDVNWVYIVKIIEAIPPYRLRNELIINKRSGQLLALY